MLNICKNRRFPIWEYFIYRLDKIKRGRWLNVWFKAEDWKDQRGKMIEQDEYWTVKECDGKTQIYLYNEKYNPLYIRIMPGYGINKGEWLMSVRLKSRDDASYGIWFHSENKAELATKRTQVMKWLSNQKVVNGEAILQYCIGLGANPSTKDYD